MKILKCCKLNFQQWRIQPKYAICAVFLIVEMWNMLLGFGDYARAIGYPIHPWLFALLPGDMLHFSTLLLPFVLIISDAPFRNRQQQFVLQRTGKLTWLSGQLLFLFATSVIYTLFIWLLSLVFVLPSTQWGSDWGIALNTAAQTGVHGQYVQMQLSYDIMKGTTPLAATAWTAFAMIFSLFLMGEIMIVCNLWMKKGIGVGVVSAFLLLDFFLGYLVGAIPRELVWISPFNWMDRSMLVHPNQNLPTFGYAAGALLGGSVLLGAVALMTIHKCNLDATKE